ncbi:MAG: hypothetical protein R2862_13270 [Thermoanaerobaculia bacterium]
MTVRQLLFFGTPEDLALGFEEFDRVTSCKWFVLRSERGPSDLGPFSHQQVFPHLGISETGSQSSDPAAMCLHADASPMFQRKNLRNGDVVHEMEQSANPDSVLVVPGGVYAAVGIVAGRMSTVSTTRYASELVRLFLSITLSGFQKIGQYRIGPRALEAARGGTRLVTMGIDEPTDYDLALT